MHFLISVYAILFQHPKIVYTFIDNYNSLDIAHHSPISPTLNPYDPRIWHPALLACCWCVAAALQKQPTVCRQHVSLALRHAIYALPTKHLHKSSISQKKGCATMFLMEDYEYACYVKKQYIPCFIRKNCVPVYIPFDSRLSSFLVVLASLGILMVVSVHLMHADSAY